MRLKCLDDRGGGCREQRGEGRAGGGAVSAAADAWVTNADPKESGPAYQAARSRDRGIWSLSDQSRLSCSPTLPTRKGDRGRRGVMCRLG